MTSTNWRLYFASLSCLWLEFYITMLTSGVVAVTDVINRSIDPILMKRKTLEYIKITVRNPRTHISREKAIYTDYEVRVETNNIAFACTDSCVRRRYSDFQWLRNRLIGQFALERSLPELPAKKVFGRFKKQFLKSRQKGLQAFLQDITGQSSYLSDIAVHLFLQTSLSVTEIQDKMANGSDSGGELLEEYQSPSVHGGCTSLSRSCSAYEDHDSGFSYSTASSLNDCVAPHAFKTTNDGCQVINPKEVEQNLSCYGLYSANNSTEKDITLKSNDDSSLLDQSSYSEHQSSDGATSSSPTSQITVVFQRSTSEHFLASNDALSSCNQLKESRLFSLSSLAGNKGYIISSDDDGYFCSNYDADDEDFGCCNNKINKGDEENNNDVEDQQQRRLHNDSDILDLDDDEDLFCFRQKTDLTIHTMQDTIQILQSRPKLTDRLYCCQEDSDDCFRESEYDVIETDDDDIDVVEVINDTTNNPETSRIEIKVRAHTMSSEEGRLIEVKTTPVRNKNKLKIGKVRSLPGMRFPIRNNGRSSSKYYRSTSEISLISPSKHQQEVESEEGKLLLDTVYDQLVLNSDYLSSRMGNNTKNFTSTPGKSSQRSESDGQQGLTSDAEYLTTIHLTCNSGDSHVDTNIDTQAEDIPPTKFLSMSSFLSVNSTKVNKKKRKAVQRLDFSSSSRSKGSVVAGTSTTSCNTTNSPQMGRFQVTTVAEVATPDSSKDLLNSTTTTKDQSHHLNKNTVDGVVTQSILNSYEII